jgi:hypothetical protein
MVEICEKKEINSLTTAYWSYMYNDDIWRKINVVIKRAIFCVTMVVLVMCEWLQLLYLRSTLLYITSDNEMIKNIWN